MDLAMQHAANDQLQPSKGVVREETPEMQRPEVTAHASFPFAASKHIPHVSDRHWLKLVLWLDAFELQELESLFKVLDLALTMDLPFANCPGRNSRGHPSRNRRAEFLLHLGVL